MENTNLTHLQEITNVLPKKLGKRNAEKVAKKSLEINQVKLEKHESDAAEGMV
jgi:hypothetical protein